MKHLAGMALMLRFLLAPPLLAFSYRVSPPMPAAGPARAFSNVDFASIPAPAPAPGPGPINSGSVPAPAPAPGPGPVNSGSPPAGPAVSTPKQPADCPRKCGDVDIPYPFGIGDNNCSWRGESFKITCNDTFSPPRPYAGNIEIIRISLEAGEMSVVSPVSYNCSNFSPNGEYTGTSVTVSSTHTPFLISPTRNVFTAIGCNTLAYLKGREDESFKTGCVTTCKSVDAAARDGDNCTGLGCCQTGIPGNLSTITIDWSTDNNSLINPKWSPCSYSFVSEKDWYNFSRQDLITEEGDDGNSFIKRFGLGAMNHIPFVFDWALRDEIDGSCQGCVSNNSYCVNATQGSGYRCTCSPGYVGNPYVADNCTNINECELRKSDPTKYYCGSGSTCHDTEGNYTCKCNFGRRGDGKGNEGCQLIFPGYAIGIVGASVASILAFVMIMVLRKRKQKQFFNKNGGEILKDMGITIFTERQLKRITNGYSSPIGEGAFGKVYMGTIDSTNQRIAVKRASLNGGEALPKKEFVSEITFQFRISHANLVRLVGCCLETNIPMLVFEYVPKGSLYNVLHGGINKQPLELSLPSRLDIAIGSAEAIAYMHSHGGHDHVHGDIKSGNILLDDDLTPKVSDFGSSKLVSVASNYPKWCVAGDMSYIDPAYIKCGRFTVKSDVYSFGVVLLELITRKTAKYGENNSLPIDFVKLCKVEGNGRNMYDGGIFNLDAQHHCYMKCLHRIGALAVRCLKEDVDERPTMAEVAEELKQVKADCMKC